MERYPYLSGLLRDVLRLVRDHARPATPDRPTVTITGEAGYKMQLKATPAPAKAPDVVKQTITAETTTGTVTLEFPGSDGVFTADEGTDVTLTQVDTDDAGNTSPPSPAFVFAVTDTIAPGAPDAPTVEVIGE